MTQLDVMYRYGVQPAAASVTAMSRIREVYGIRGLVLNEAERAAVTPGVWINDSLFGRLDTWIEKHYRDRLAPSDLTDPQLLAESRTALDELTQILGLGSLYDFQR